MSAQESRMLVTGASGQLGRLVIAALLKTIPATRIAAIARSPQAVAELSSRGVQAQTADYSKPDTLDVALVGIDRLLLISSSELGQRFAQHRNVIDAAKRAGVGLLVYTSVLRAATSPLGLAEEHRQTEAAIAASGIPFVVLRNGWYTENYTASIPPALAHGAFLGSAGDGLIASAARADYADAAAAVLAADAGHAGRTYELAGDDAYTLSQFAAAIAIASGQPVVYKDLPEAAFKTALVGAGLPEPIASLLADSDAGAAKGALFDDSHALSGLIGRSTTPFATTIAAAISGAPV